MGTVRWRGCEGTQSSGRLWIKGVEFVEPRNVLVERDDSISISIKLHKKLFFAHVSVAHDLTLEQLLRKQRPLTLRNRTCTPARQGWEMRRRAFKDTPLKQFKKTCLFPVVLVEQLDGLLTRRNVFITKLKVFELRRGSPPDNEIGIRDHSIRICVQRLNCSLFASANVTATALQAPQQSNYLELKLIQIIPIVIAHHSQLVG